MKKQNYDLATEKLNIINWLQDEINNLSNSKHPDTLRVRFELRGYDLKNHILPSELREEVCNVADKVKEFYISEKEKLEKELDAI